MKKPRYASLYSVLKDYKASDLNIVSSVILTYEFDPLLAETLSNTGIVSCNTTTDGLIRWSGAFPSIIFYDPNCTQPTKQLPGNFEIHFWKKSSFCCHHAKAYAFLLSDGSAELILGSFNFTASGLFRNREVMLRFRLSLDDVFQYSIFSQWREILIHNYVMRGSSSVVLRDYIEGLNCLLKKIKNQKKTRIFNCPVQLIFSGTNQQKTGFDKLLEFMRKNGLLEPCELVCVSPFFDGVGSNKKIFEKVLKTFPKLETVHIYSDIPDESWNSGAFPGADLVRFFRWQITQTIDEQELKNLTDEIGEDLGRKPKGVRPLHAKILLLRDRSGKALLYVGSANFTANAWLGGNVELGAAIILERWPAKSSSQWVQRVFGLGDRGVRKVCFPMREDTSILEDPEDRIDDVFPETLDSIELRQIALADKEKLCGGFIFNVVCQTEKVTEFVGEFHWGNLALSLTWSNQSRAWVSQAIDFDTMQSQLIVSRSVEYRKNGKTICIPFNVSLELGIAAEMTFVTNPEASLDFITSVLTHRYSKKNYLLEYSMLLVKCKGKIQKKI